MNKQEHHKHINAFWRQWLDHHIYEIDHVTPRTKDYRILWVYDRLKTHEKIKKVFDAGCGNGWHCRFLKDKGYDVMGVDISAPALKIARKANRDISFKREDLETIEPIMGYDALICLNVLNNVYDYKKALDNLYKFKTPYMYISMDMHKLSKVHKHVWTQDECVSIFSGYGKITDAYKGSDQNIYEIYNDHVSQSSSSS